MKRIFVDTSAWVEFSIRKERYHEAIDDYIVEETKRGSSFFTSDYVLDETYTKLITGESFSIASLFQKKVREAEKQENLTIVWIDETLFYSSWKTFEKFADHKLSFTDATSVTIVQRLKLDEVLTLDTDFTKAGLTIQPRLK